jgi:hypothetical protein
VPVGGAPGRSARVALVVFALGRINFARFAARTPVATEPPCERFVTRAKRYLATTVGRDLRQRATPQDMLVWIGSGANRQLVRRVSIHHRGVWRRSLTSALDPARSPPEYMVVKRLLGLAYLWVGSENGVQIQLWPVPSRGWLHYAVLVDSMDSVAEALEPAT